MIVFAIVIAVLILIMNLSVHVETKVKGKEFSVVIKLWKIKIFQSPLRKEKAGKKNKQKEKEQTNKEKQFTAENLSFYLERIGEILKDVKKLFRFARQKMICHKFCFTLTFGKEDAAQVGILYGLIWAGIGNLLPVIQSFMVLKEPHIQVVPVYHREYFLIEYEGHFKLKIYHLTGLAVKALFVFTKHLRQYAKYNKKGGVSHG